jgi:hypothetical protein
VRIRSENTFYDIIDYVRPENKNYIILESLNQLKDNNNYKSIQVITLEENEKIIMVYFKIKQINHKNREEATKQM